MSRDAGSGALADGSPGPVADPPGSVVLSLDAELGWGFHHRDPVPTDRVLAGRDAWRRLLAYLDARDLPATWAVVGHLLLAECPGGHRGHPAGPDCCRAGANRDGGGMAGDGDAGRVVGDGDVGGRVAGDGDDVRGVAGDGDGSGRVAGGGDAGGTSGDAAPPEAVWFARDLVRAVRAADAGHELAAHGFTHVHFRHEGMSRGFAARELRRCRAAANDFGFAPTSFVFPVNEVAHRDLLAGHGFAAYRGPSPAVAGGSLRRRGRKLLSAVGRGSPPLVTPRIDEHGLVDVPASLYLFGFDGPARALVERVREDPVVGAVRRGLDRLAAAGGVLHLWLHPHDLAAPAADARVRAVLDAVARARERDGVRVETMRDVAAQVRETAPEAG